MFDILLKFTEMKNWEEAFDKVIPKRKVTASKELPKFQTETTDKDTNNTDSMNSTESSSSAQ